jgi:hypothetical protein
MIPCVGCVSVNATVILTDGVSIAAGCDDNKIRISFRFSFFNALIQKRFLFFADF